MARRRRRAAALSLDEVTSIAARLAPSTLIVDVEPLVVSWQTIASEAFVERASRLRALVFASVPSATHIVFVSNSRRPRESLPELPGAETWVVSSAGKPWRMRYMCGLPRPVVVLGDQILTDGLLAWRLGADFVHVGCGVSAPWWPRLQEIIGRPLVRALFHTETPTGGCHDLQ